MVNHSTMSTSHRWMTFLAFTSFLFFTANAQPQPLRSIFTDYLDTWAHFVNNTLNRLPTPSQPPTPEQRQCLHDLNFLVSAASTRQPWAIQSKMPLYFFAEILATIVFLVKQEIVLFLYICATHIRCVCVCLWNTSILCWACVIFCPIQI